MTKTCGATTQRGTPCARVAGWGTAHKGEGRCKHHDTPAEPEQLAGGGVNHAAQYVINDGVDYALPGIRSTFAPQKQMQEVAQYFEWTQKQTMRFQFDAPNRTAYDAPVWMPSDDPLLEWDYATRLAVWTNCHAAYHRNPIAKQAVNVTRQFAVGKGHTVTAANKDVDDVIKRFRDNPENAISEYDKSFVQDLQVDGELIIRKFDGGVDGSVIVPIPPWHIDDIDTEPGFFRRVTSYHMQYADQYGNFYEEDLPATDVLFVAINRHSYELRGRSDLFTALPWLRAYKEWLENRARQNQWRGALVWDVAVEGTPAAVSGAVSKYSTPPTPGSVVVHHANEQWQALTNNVNAGDAAEDGRQIKLMNAVSFGLPEYMLSDGENANLASATAQELPALWKFVDVQDIMTEQVWTPIYKWVIQQAVDAGEIPEMVTVEDSEGEPKRDSNGATMQVKAIEAFTVDYPELTEDDPKTLAEALQISTLNDWVSNEGASTAIAGKFGLDPNVERKRVQMEKTEARDELAQGLRNPTPAELMRDDGEQAQQERGDQPPNADE
jgi:hypothetical protein